jgi:type II secretory pathway component PulF
MPFFQYRARDKAGALITGSLEAEDMAAMETSLDRMGLIPIKVAAKKSVRLKLPKLNSLFQKVEQQEIILFSRQLATLFGAGVPLTRALTTLESQITNPKFVSVIKAIREDIEGGSAFAAAISKHPKVFPEIYATLIEVGEAGGILDEVLERLAALFEKNAENTQKIKSATLYPKIVIGAVFVAIFILMNFVVPRFAKLYASFDADLPLPTRILITLSNAFAAYWYIALILFALLYIAAKLFFSSEGGKRMRDRVVLKIPVFGPLLLKSTLSRFSGVLGAMYNSGLPILQALDIVSRVVQNRIISDEIKRMEAEVRGGKNLSEPMAASTHFPPMVVQMVTVGEETGKLDEMLEKVAEYYDKEVDSAIKNLTTMLEPILLSFIFVVVLFLALAIFLPMWDILKIVRR